MNQFKDHFLGKVKLEFTRATTCQKCLRTGDIDNVGRTAYHHTFFEMLGNFSFGDYFKREAIHWAWEFLTDKKWLGIDPERLTRHGLSRRRRSRQHLARRNRPADRAHRAAGRGRKLLASQRSQPRSRRRVRTVQRNLLSHATIGKTVEIWNLVFTQFNRVGNPPNNLRPLPSKNIDTGMGLERIGVGHARRGNELPHRYPAAARRSGRRSVRHQVRSGQRQRSPACAASPTTFAPASFAIHENVLPGANKQKYVIRRLLRRAILDGHQMGLREPFLYKLVGMVAEHDEESVSGTARYDDAWSPTRSKPKKRIFSARSTRACRRIDKVFGDMKFALRDAS